MSPADHLTTPADPRPPLLEVRNLRLDLPVANGTLHALRGVDLTLAPGRTLGLVGESGSGKSLTALSIMGLHPRAGQRSADRLTLAGRDLGAMSEPDLARSVRGQVAGMIFQEPMTALNPVMTVGRQLTETVLIHGLMTADEARTRAIALLERVGIAGAERRLAQYPHQFSGGQRQRLTIAMALMAKPKLIIADEPTTALDVTVQAEILRLLAELRDEFGMGLIIVTHNLGIVSRIADDVAVMYAGEVVEQAPVADLFTRPRHPYTRGLLAAVPDSALVPHGARLGAIPGVVPALVGAVVGCAFAPRCAEAVDACATQTPPLQVTGPATAHRCVHRDPPAHVAAVNATIAVTRRDAEPALTARGLVRRYPVRRGIFSPPAMLTAAAGIDLDVSAGEIVAIVGESGCGKSTLARLLLGLEQPDEGHLSLFGTPLDQIDARARARLVQPVFQDPRGSLNPRRSVSEIVRRPLDVHGIGAAADREAAVLKAMDDVGLPRRLYHAYPAQLSGGQRQRVAIARALALEPRMLLCDEPTSALDVSVQAQILNLIADLRADRALTIVMITHDLGVVEHMADRVAVMYLGRIVEVAATGDLFREPRHPYTRALIGAALPVAAGAGIPSPRLGPGFPNPLDMPPGCPFQPRCLEAIARCASERPELRHQEVGAVACHLADHSGSATPGPQRVPEVFA